MTDSTIRNGQPDRDERRAGADRVAFEAVTVMRIDEHLKEAARLLASTRAPYSPELFRVLLPGLAKLCGLVADHAHEAPAAPPILFKDRIVAEALGVWKSKIRRAR